MLDLFSSITTVILEVLAEIFLPKKEEESKPVPKPEARPAPWTAKHPRLIKKQ